MMSLAACLFAATLAKPVVVVQWQYYPVRELPGGYLGRFPDQPLVVDSDLPEDKDRRDIHPYPGWGMYHSMADIDAMYAEGRRYGLDGFAFFPNYRRKAHWRARNSSVPGMLTVPIVNFWHDKNTDDDIASIGKAVEYGCSAKHGGKTIVLSYWTDRFNTPEQLAAKLKLARERLGDTFLYLVATSWQKGLWDWNATGKVPESRMEGMKAHFRDMLRVADGMILDGTMSNISISNQTRVFNDGYHRLMAATARAVADEPEFKGRKLLGFTLSNGHQNGNEQSWSANAMGTRTLRESFANVIAAAPDVILIPEWDECNESTSWKPTLYNGYSTKRLFRYYDTVLRKRPQSVMEGDDTSVPNVILSYRKALSPGEWFYFEAVNVPDGARSGELELSVELSDENGRVIASLPAKKVREDVLDTVWWDVHSDEIAPLARAVDVRLRWRKGDGAAVEVSGFHPIDLAPANSWNLKDVKQPIRDLAPVSCRRFALEGGKVSADISCGEPIRHAMLCGNGWIQYIHNPASYCSRFRADEDHAVFEIAALRPSSVKTTCRYSVPGVPEAEWLFWKQEGKGENFAFSNWLSETGFNVYLRIPRTKLAGARLAIDLADVMPKAEVSLSEVERLGAWAAGGADSRGTECAVVRFGKQSRYPSTLNAKACSFSVAPDADRDSMMYHLQVVTMGGKTWRSRPLVAEKPGEMVLTKVYAALKDRAVPCALPRSRVPRLEYLFTPESGDVLRTASGERHFFGILGSQPCLATLWNGGSDNFGPFPNGDAFWRTVKDPHPAWVKESDGRWSLAFDGIDDFVAFPQETIPQWATPSIDVEFRQAASGAKRMETLFSTRYRIRVGAYETLLDKGEIVIRSSVFSHDVGKTFEFRTGLVAMPDAWHSLNVGHTGLDMVVSLDGKVATQRISPLAVMMTTAILGGAPVEGTSFFTGRVRRFAVDHAAQ